MTGSAEIAERGPVEWDMQVVWMDPEDLVPNTENPNQQDDATFNALVREIQREGWTQPVQAVFDHARGKHEIVAGEHRWRAARILQCKVPVLPLPPEEFDRDRRDWVMVKDNLLKGHLNPEKFTQLYNRMVKKYDGEVLKALMGFTSDDAFQKVYQEVRRTLPPEMQAALDATKDEIRTIDDLSTVLNRLFRDHGETLDSNFMVFSYGGKDVIWVRADADLWKRVKAMADSAKKDQGDLTADLKTALGVG